MTMRPLEASEQKEVSGVTQTDPDFVALVRTNYDRVCRWARTFGLSPDEAEDAAQEVFVLAHRRRPEVSTTAWLYGTVRRVCSTHRRGARRRHRKFEAMTWVTAQSAPPQQPELVERHERLRRFGAFCDTLEESTRRTFTLHIIDGLKPKEIAHLEDVSVDTIYSRIRRAKQRFAVWLESERADG